MRWLLLLAFIAPCFAPLQARAQTTVQTTAQTLEILSPRDERSTPREFVHVLGRTAPGARVTVGGEVVTVFSTGVFARDRVPLALGKNRIAIEAVLASGEQLGRQLDIERVSPPPVQWPTDRLFINGASLLPAETVRVAPGEGVEVAAQATPGQRVEARLAGQRWQALTEAPLASGRFRALLRFEGSDDVAAAPVQLRVSAQTLPSEAKGQTISTLTMGEAGQWRADPERLFVVGADGADLLHGLHEVRLGGPNLAELQAGVLLPVTGQQGAWLRVQLTPDVTAWVAAKSVAAAPAGTAMPHAAPTTLSVSGAADGDVVNVPLDARVPAAVRAVAAADGRQHLEIELFGAHHAVTWITHRASAKLVRELTAEQAGPARVRVNVWPTEARLWGWRVERTATALRLFVRAAPPLAGPTVSPLGSPLVSPSVSPSVSPLAGLRVALEPGHGSADNLGAVGATAVPEKDINRFTAQALKAELESVGAQVVVVREGDDNPNQRERARRVTESQAHLFVSLHANAADTAAGFLRTSGTSTFYKHANGRDLAAAVQRRMLEQTGLDDFGLVGNFNYAPIRWVTWMPAILVEQAFVTHPGDEARLLDPAFRAVIARAVRLGLEDFLRSR